ncbi:MAG: GntR family transcriptional regulator [Acidimicrobiales bacterium]
MESVEIDRSSPLPLWAQVADTLRHMLAGGEFESRFPPEDELSRSFGVSRQTVRQAVGHLESEGLLLRRRGVGTQVVSPLEPPGQTLYNLTSDLKARGVKEEIETLSLKLVKAPRTILAQLKVESGSTVVYVERLRSGDSTPVAWDRSWLRSDKTSALLRVELNQVNLYDALATYCGVRITGGSERIRSVLPTPAQQRRLQIPPRASAFGIERVALCEDEPIEVRKTLIRGDRYSLLSTWPQPQWPHAGSA